MPYKEEALYYAPSVIAGVICGVIAIVNRPLLIDAFFVAVLSAIVITNVAFGFRYSEHLFGSLAITGPICALITAFSMIVSGVALTAYMKLFGG